MIHNITDYDNLKELCLMLGMILLGMAFATIENKWVDRVMKSLLWFSICYWIGRLFIWLFTI